MSDLVHLHVHSYYSLMDGLNSPLELAQAAKDLGQPALAITDHGTLSGHRALQRAAKEVGIKPILGLEAYLSPTDRFDRREIKKREDNTQLYNHVVILAKGAEGYRNLNQLSEIAWTEGFYSKPRIDKEVLTKYRKGLIVLSGCLNGVVAKAIEKGDSEGADAWMDYFVTTFGADFYVELQPDNPVEINRGLHQYARKYGAKTVVTADCHFANEKDRALEEAMLILSTNPKMNRDATYENTKHLDIFERLNTLYPDRPISFEKLDLFMQGRGNMIDKFVAQGIEDTEMYESTLEIADKIGDYDYHENLELLPMPKSDPDKRLRELVENGLKRMGLWDKPEYRERADEEIQIVVDKKFSPYFLMVADTVQWAKRQKIRVGPGRGSAAGSLICYALGITQADPIKFNLLFFRFIDPSRPDWPDIDVDFEVRRRKEVKDYLRRKFKNVASISTFGMFKDKGVIRDAARVFAVPIGEVNKALKGVEVDPNAKQDYFDVFLKSEKGKEFALKYPEVMEYARGLRGRIRSVGMHAAGMVVSREPINLYAPIETRTDPQDKVSGRIPVVALDMDEVASIGLIKLDYLGLKNLSVLEDAILQVAQRHGKDIVLEELPLEDSAIYEDLSNGRTVGIFQAEAKPYTRLLKTLKVSNFEELAASTALVRPGAMNTVGKSYTDRMHGKEQVRYLHSILEPITKETYGTIIYQEQVMLACTELGGMTMAAANKVRKIIGKKKDVKEFEAYQSEFIKGASMHISEPQAEALWHDFEAHAGYSFNRSHAIAYSLITYWTAWLKHYYPVEFMYALLLNEDPGAQDNKITEYLIESKRLGIRILLPHVERSDVNFAIEDNCIRFGLSSIKYISDTLATRLTDARPFSSYQELQELVSTKNSGLSSRVLSALNAIGAAAYDDNPRTGTEKYNYWEYLGIPKFNTLEMPDYMNSRIRDLDEYSEDESFIIRAMVKKIKRGKGWSRVEFVDETGTAAAFHGEETQIEAGQMYFILIANNRITRYVPIDDVLTALKEGTEDAFVYYLTTPDLGLVPGLYYVMRMEKRMTKAKQLMGTLVLVNADGDIQKVLAFPKIFPQVYTNAKEGMVVDMTFTRLDDGGLCVRSI